MLRRQIDSVVVLWVRIGGPNGSTREWMALDTGATFVTIPTDAARNLGYDLDQPNSTISVATANGVTEAPLIELASVETMGARSDHVRAICLDMPEGLRFRGLLGMSFLRNFDIDLHLRSGTLKFR